MTRVGNRGQSTVEFALILPLILFLLLALLQAGLFMRDQLLVVGAAREGAREAAVSPQSSRIEAAAARAAPGLDLAVEIDRASKRGGLVKVEVSAAPTAIPLVGAIVANVRLQAEATMRVESGG